MSRRYFIKISSENYYSEPIDLDDSVNLFSSNRNDILPNFFKNVEKYVGTIMILTMYKKFECEKRNFQVGRKTERK